MDNLYIKGGRELKGSLDIVSAKNALLPILAGSIISNKMIVIHKVAMFSDVVFMTKILESLGSKVIVQGDSLIIDSTNADKVVVKDEFTKKVRSSIFMLGPLLSRFRKARVAYPGGCNIGNRPIDLHIKGLKCLNVKIFEKHGYIFCDGKNMKAGEVHLDFPSVGATENIMMSATLIKGQTTTILNSAKEPEIIDLANFINSIGGNIKGAGTSTIIIEGVEKLKGGEYTPISDRIIAGTYLIAGAMTKGKIRLTNASYKDVYALLNKLRNSGCYIDYRGDIIELEMIKRPTSCASIETQPYPGFPTDMQAQILAMQTISDGISIVTENMFETRFKHVPELVKMGAKVTTKDRMAIVRGVECLYGAEVVAHDLRGGAGLVLAGLVAKGTTIVTNANYIDRGYSEIEEKYRMLGADIRRVKN